MINKNMIQWQKIQSYIRRPIVQGALLISISLATILLLLVPLNVELSYQYSRIEYPIQPLYLIESPYLYGIIFYFWFMGIALLGSSLNKQKRADAFLGAYLIFIFSIVFLGYWMVYKYPIYRSGDEYIFAGHINNLQANEGIIPGVAPYFYLNFPGFFILLDFISELSGLSPLTTIYLFSIMGSVLFSFLFYTLSLRIFRIPSRAVGCTVLFLMGSILYPKFINMANPQNLALSLFLVFCVLSWKETSATKGFFQRMTGVKIALFISIIIVHLPTALILVIFWGLIFVLQNVVWWKRGKMVLFKYLLIPVAFLLIWEMSVATSNFQNLIDSVGEFFSELSSGKIGLPAYLIRSSSLAGGYHYPFWAKGIQYFWLFFTYILGAAISLLRMFRVSRLRRWEQVEIAGAISCGIVLIPALFYDQGIFLYKIALFGGIFFTLVIFRELYRFLFRKKRGRLIVSVFVCILIMSLPTAFVVNQYIGVTYPYQTTTSEFMVSYAEENRSIDVYCFNPDVHINKFYYLPDGKYIYEGEPTNFEEEHYEGQVETMVLDWEKRGQSQGSTLFILSERQKQFAQYNYGVAFPNPSWDHLENNLSNDNLIYSNGDTWIYSRA